MEGKPMASAFETTAPARGTDAGKATVGELARVIAKERDGRIATDPVWLDRVEGVEILISPTPERPRYTESTVVVHDGRVYLITGGAVRGYSFSDQMEELRKSWRWAEEPRKAK